MCTVITTTFLYHRKIEALITGALHHRSWKRPEYILTRKIRRTSQESAAYKRSESGSNVLFTPGNAKRERWNSIVCSPRAHQRGKVKKAELSGNVNKTSSRSTVENKRADFFRSCGLLTRRKRSRKRLLRNTEKQSANKNVDEHQLNNVESIRPDQKARLLAGERQSSIAAALKDVLPRSHVIIVVLARVMAA